MATASLAAQRVVPTTSGRGFYDPEWSWVWRGLELALTVDPTRSAYTDHVRLRFPVNAGGAAPYRLTPAGVGLDFTGSTTGGYVVVNDNSIAQDLRPAASWTIAAVVWSDGEAASQGILAKGANSEAAGSNHNFWLSYDQATFVDDQAGNGWVVGFEQASSAGTNVTAKYVTTNDTGVHVVMGVLDTVAQELRVYVDGILGRTRTSVTTVGETNGIDMTVGRFMSNGDSINRWNGTITGAWLWKNRAFTTPEAQRWMQNPFGMFRRPLVAVNAVAAAGTGRRSFCAGMIG